MTPEAQVHKLTEQELKELLLTKARVAIDMNPAVFHAMVEMVFETVWARRWSLVKEGDKFNLTIMEM